MNDPGKKDEQELQGKVSRRRTRAGMLAVTLGLTASLVASPTVKREMVSAPESHVEGKKPVERHHWLQIGTASWYGGRFNGRTTANGEKFDMYSLTCAHRTLPLGSWVRVTNLKNRKFVFLRVNDRGPVPESLILDLSYAAAVKLGVSGLAKIRLEAVKPSDSHIAEQMVAQLKLDDPALLQAKMAPLAGAMLIADQ